MLLKKLLKLSVLQNVHLKYGHDNNSIYFIGLFYD